jgi:MIP family channel proteins
MAKLEQQANQQASTGHSQQQDPQQHIPKQHGPKQHTAQDKSDRGLFHCLAAELVGTFLLVFVDSGGAMIAALSHDTVTLEMRSLATGMIIMAMVYSLGSVSGAHINPVVSFAFSLRRVFPWRRLPLYWLAQIIGAVLAALLLQNLLGDVKHLGATTPHVPDHQALLMEIALTTILVFVALSTATLHRVVGPNAAIAVGATVALCNLFAKPISDASMNPARSLGPALVGSHYAHLWIYLAGPLVGSAIAVVLVFLIHGLPKRGEEEAASGKEQ